MWLADFIKYMSKKKESYVLKLYTEGIENVLWVAGISSGTGDRAKNSDHLYLLSGPSTTSGQYAYVTDTTIDLTDINTRFDRRCFLQSFHGFTATD